MSLAAAALVAACSGTPSRESTGQYIDDSTITTKVKSAFVRDEAVSALRIGVETYKGKVQLSGFANSPQEITRATELARTVPGVKAVDNDIRLKSN
jgi:osmotically-inducible protein OsmY